MFRFYPLVVLVSLTGCSEGTKPNPLSRDGAPVAPVALPAPIVAKDPIKESEPKTKTLYERLGREEGLARTVDQMVLDMAESSKTKGLAGRLSKRLMTDFLVEASSKPRTGLADDVRLSPPDWMLVIPALRLTLISQGAPEADRDELLANIEKSR